MGRVPHLSTYLSIYLPMYISLLILLYLFIFSLSLPFPYEENFHVRYAHTATAFANTPCVWRRVELSLYQRASTLDHSADVNQQLQRVSPLSSPSGKEKASNIIAKLLVPELHTPCDAVYSTSAENTVKCLYISSVVST